LIATELNYGIPLVEAYNWQSASSPLRHKRRNAPPQKHASTRSPRRHQLNREVEAEQDGSRYPHRCAVFLAKTGTPGMLWMMVGYSAGDFRYLSNLADRQKRFWYAAPVSDQQ